MPDATLYLFDGYNLLHASPYDDARELVDALASFVATQGARGVVVFDGVGEDAERGPLSVRYVARRRHAARAARRRAPRPRAGRWSSPRTSRCSRPPAARSRNLSSQTFFRDFGRLRSADRRAGGLADKLDAETRARLERLRRGE